MAGLHTDSTAYMFAFERHPTMMSAPCLEDCISSELHWPQAVHVEFEQHACQACHDGGWSSAGLSVSQCALPGQALQVLLCCDIHRKARFERLAFDFLRE